MGRGRRLGCELRMNMIGGRGWVLLPKSMSVKEVGLSFFEPDVDGR